MMWHMSSDQCDKMVWCQWQGLSFRYQWGEGKLGGEWVSGCDGSAHLFQHMGHQVHVLLLQVMAVIINNCLNEAMGD